MLVHRNFENISALKSISSRNKSYIVSHASDTFIFAFGKCWYTIWATCVAWRGSSSNRLIKLQDFESSIWIYRKFWIMAHIIFCTELLLSYFNKTDLKMPVKIPQPFVAITSPCSLISRTYVSSKSQKLYCSKLNLVISFWLVS